jgi:hypothetical protein
MLRNNFIFSKQKTVWLDILLILHRTQNKAKEIIAQDFIFYI